MKQIFYTGYYYVFLSGYVSAVFLYYFISYVILAKDYDASIVLAPAVLISLCFLGLSIYSRKRPLFVITNENYKIKKLNWKYRIFDKKNTKIIILPKEIHFKTADNTFKFRFRLNMGKRAWNKIVKGLENDIKKQGSN